MIAPYIKTKNNVQLIMLDVILSLLPLVAAAWWAFGIRAALVIGCCVLSCMLADVIFRMIFLGQFRWVPDGSAIITGLLLSFTLSPLTPLYVVCFGGFMSILFGKILWGGLGKNAFNPALVGREFMTVFFPVIMNGGMIWDTGAYVVNPAVDLFSGLQNEALAKYLNSLIYRPSGALGEFAIGAILLGGIFLLLKNRITWHIPVCFLVSFSILRLLLGEAELNNFSIGGMLLGCFYMATDMPTSPSHAHGKIYYGSMLGITVAILLYCGINFAYLSYGILIMNAFNVQINTLLKPQAWGTKQQAGRWEDYGRLTVYILGTTMAAIGLHLVGLIHWAVYIYVLYVMLKYYYQYQYKILQPF